MRWFTRGWQTGELSDAEWEQVAEEYERHMRAIRPTLPSGLQLPGEAGGPVSLHDGRIVDARWKVGSPGVLLADIAAWDMQRGALVGKV